METPEAARRRKGVDGGERKHHYPWVVRRSGPLLVLALLLVVAFTTEATSPIDAGYPASMRAEGIFKLDHLIFLVMENRSFDHYFGTYPGADGIPMQDGKPIACVQRMQAVLGRHPIVRPPIWTERAW